LSTEVDLTAAGDQVNLRGIKVCGTVIGGYVKGLSLVDFEPKNVLFLYVKGYLMPVPSGLERRRSE
jgi:hypothetical protein